MAKQDDKEPRDSGEKSKVSDNNYGSVYSALREPSELTKIIRREAYGDDVGQHSWTSVTELNRFISLLKLATDSQLLDIGCGCGGPAIYLAVKTGCSISGIDISAEGIELANARAAAENLSGRVSFLLKDAANLEQESSACFDAVLACDAVIHIKDRKRLFSSIHRMLKPGGRFLFTDAGVITGIVSNQAISSRSVHGFTQFSCPSFNEQCLRECGFASVIVEDATANLLEIAQGRLKAREKYKHKLELEEGSQKYLREQAYLSEVIVLSAENNLSRFFYLAMKDGV